VLPRFEVREVVVDHVVQHETPLEVPKISMRPVEVPEITTHSVDIPIPRFVSPAPETSAATAPRTPEERRFEQGAAWKGAIVRGRIQRDAPPNGFVLATESGEQSFYPAKPGPKGPEMDPTRRDDLTGLLGRLAVCRETQLKTYICVSLAPGGGEVIIPQRPMPVGEPL
jgi:hypothetical protein